MRIELVYHWAPLDAPFTKWFRKTVELGILPSIDWALVDNYDFVFIVKEVSLDLRSGEVSVYVQIDGDWGNERQQELVRLLSALGWFED